MLVTHSDILPARDWFTAKPKAVDVRVSFPRNGVQFLPLQKKKDPKRKKGQVTPRFPPTRRLPSSLLHSPGPGLPQSSTIPPSLYSHGPSAG